MQSFSTMVLNIVFALAGERRGPAGGGAGGDLTASQLRGRGTGSAGRGTEACATHSHYVRNCTKKSA